MVGDITMPYDRVYQFVQNPPANCFWLGFYDENNVAWTLWDRDWTDNWQPGRPNSLTGRRVGDFRVRRTRPNSVYEELNLIDLE